MLSALGEYMPIEFQLQKRDGYFTAKWLGKVSDSESFNSYKDFYEGPEWSPDLNELGDLSKSDMSSITADGLRSLGVLVENHFINHNVDSSKTAVYSPNDLPFGLARIYQTWVDQSAENVKVFRDLKDAELWLCEGK
jgi:hypothetical protein